MEEITSELRKIEREVGVLVEWVRLEKPLKNLKAVGVDMMRVDEVKC